MINLDLIEAIMDKWDTTNWVLRFGMVEMCPTIKEYVRLIGVPHNSEKIVILCLELSFKERLSKTLWIKRKSLETEGELFEYKRRPFELVL